MKALIFTAIAFFLLSTIALAKVEYVVDVTIDIDKKSHVKLFITFLEATESFDIIIFGRIDDFDANATKPISCKLGINEVSSINCLTSFTELETLKITFTTYDFVRVLDNKYYFLADLSLWKEIKKLDAVVRIPEGMSLSDEKIFPPNGKPSSDGRRIIVMWREENILPTQPLKFQLTYEQPIIPPPVIQPWQFIAIAVVAALLPTYLVLRKARKPSEIILSILDEFERKVMDVIAAHGGKVNQKIIVKETGLSKAKVSRVVRSLASKKLIKVERFGRTNILRLTKKISRL